MTERAVDAPLEELLIQLCASCGRYQHYPRPACRHCHGTDLAMIAASGEGTVYSFTIVHRSPVEYLTAPYALALVRLTEGPVLMSHVVGVTVDEVRCEMPVVLTWRQVTEDLRLPMFTPALPRPVA